MFINFLKKSKHYLYLIIRAGRRIYYWLKDILKKYVTVLFPGIVSFVVFHWLRRVIQIAYNYDIAKINDGKRVAIITRDGLSYPKSSVFIRLLSPLSVLANEGKVSIDLYGENTQTVAKGTDVAIVQRTAFDSKAAANEFIKYTKKNKIPIIIDNDDAFHAIDRSHPEYGIQKSRSDAVDLLKKTAHEVWFSTEKLARAYTELGDKRKVMRNTIDSRLWPMLGREPRVPRVNEPLQIVYMGTVTHDADFRVILSVLEKLAIKYPGSFKLTVIGVSKDVPDYNWIKRLYQPKNGSIYPRFTKWLSVQGPFDIGVAPLVESEFNDGKSDIKCLDYLACGIIPLASDVTAYKGKDIKPFIISVKNTETDWYKAIEDQIKNKEANRKQRPQKIALAHDYIEKQRSTTILANKMYQRLVKLTDK